MLRWRDCRGPESRLCGRTRLLWRDTHRLWSPSLLSPSLLSPSRAPSVENHRLEHDAAQIASSVKKKRIFLTSDRQNRIVGSQMIGGSSIWPILHRPIDPVQSDNCVALFPCRSTARRRGCDRLTWSSGASAYEFAC